MNILPPASASGALNGIQRGIDGLQRNAAEIAGVSGPNGGEVRSMVEPLVELRMNVQQVEASVQVLKAEDRALGALLDVKV